MDEKEGLADRFEAHRGHLKAVAYRMLGSSSEADDAVQEAWLRLVRRETSGLENLGGFLTTVVARICLDMLRSRKSRRERPDDPNVIGSVPHTGDEASPEHDAVLADSVGLALLVVLETLTPSERLAFVLHDLFDLPFDEIAAIIGCSEPAARQLASRARRRVRRDPADLDADHDVTEQRRVVEAFLVASRNGDLTGLLALLAPDAILRADPVAVAASQARRAEGAFVLFPEIDGGPAVAKTFSGRAQEARVAFLDGVVGAVWAPGGTPRAVLEFTIEGGKIVAIDLSADPAHLRAVDVRMLEA